VGTESMLCLKFFMTSSIGFNSKRIPPGRRFESFIRSINANNGKWFRHARRVSSVALSMIIAILVDANVR